MAATLHVYDRGVIMRRAWTIARQRRDEAAREAFDLNVRIVGSRIIHLRPLAAFIAETPLDLGTAQKAAWAEAKRANDQNSKTGALIIVRQGGALAPLRRRFSRALPLLIAASRWLRQRVATARAA